MQAGNPQRHPALQRRGAGGRCDGRCPREEAPCPSVAGGSRAPGGWERGTPTGRDSPRPSPPLAPPASSFQLPTGPFALPLP